jgi:hypothetical protein
MSVPLRDHKVGVDRINDYPERIDGEVLRNSPRIIFPAPSIALCRRCRARRDRYIACPAVGIRGQARGAALVARNIAGMLESTFADKPRTWTPLVYCWRGSAAQWEH